jgi:hypothetical protein
MAIRIRTIAIAALFGAVSFVPHPAKAADPATVEQLITVLKVERQVAQLREILEKSFEQGLDDAAHKHGMTQAEIDRGKPILVAAMMKSFDEAFSWEQMKPQYVKIYAEELTDDEVNATIAYYTSPQGQSMLAKLPVLMKRGSDIGMARGREMGPKLDAAMNEAIRQIREGETKDAKANVENAMKQVHATQAKDASTTGPSAADTPAASEKDKDAGQKVATPDAKSDKTDPQH